MPEFDVNFQLVDSMGRPGRKNFQTVATMVDFAAAKVAANSMAIALDNVTQMAILAYSVAERTIYSDSIDAQANKDEGATITLRKADNRNAVHRIPAPVQALRLQDGTVDLANAALIAYFAQFFAGGDFTLSDGELVALVLRGLIDV